MKKFERKAKLHETGAILLDIRPHLVYPVSSLIEAGARMSLAQRHASPPIGRYPVIGASLYARDTHTPPADSWWAQPTREAFQQRQRAELPRLTGQQITDGPR